MAIAEYEQKRGKVILTGVGMPRQSLILDESAAGLAKAIGLSKHAIRKLERGRGCSEDTKARLYFYSLKCRKPKGKKPQGGQSARTIYKSEDLKPVFTPPRQEATGGRESEGMVITLPNGQKRRLSVNNCVTGKLLKMAKTEQDIQFITITQSIRVAEKIGQGEQGIRLAYAELNKLSKPEDKKWQKPQ